MPPECIELVAAPFSAPNPSSLHGQSHWQVSTSEDFTSIEAESWKTYQNWYDNVNTQEGDDISDEEIIGLNENSTYWWRVRYRDREFNWSDWSDPSMFQTGASILGPNLLANPGAEDSLSGWTVRAGVVEALTSGVCNGIAPYRGERYFIVGGLCTESDQAECFQNVDVSMYAESIDEGEMQAHFGGYLSNYAGSDQPELFIAFLDQNGIETKASEVLSTLNDNWTMLGLWDSIPPGTRTIQMTLRGTRRAGEDNDSYFDELFLRIQEEEVRCDDLVNTDHQNNRRLTLSSSPNPAHDATWIDLPFGFEGEVDIRIIDSSGRKYSTPHMIGKGRVKVERGGLSTGTYTILIKSSGDLQAVSKVVFF